jgi:hypothetical protein
MKIINLLLALVFLVAVSGCKQDDLDPNQFRRDGQPKDNTYILREGTTVLLETEQDQLLAVDSATVRFSSGSEYAANVQPGDIIVNPFGGENAFIRRVTSISAQGDAIIMQTEFAQMTDAFSAWIIDSRTSTLTLKNRSGFEESRLCQWALHMGLPGKSQPAIHRQGGHDLFRWR